jgi:hypothetical protein
MAHSCGESRNHVSLDRDSCCTNSLTLPSPKLRCMCNLSPPRHRFPVSPSGITKSRFLLQRFPCMQKSRNAEPQILQDPWTRVLQINGSDRVREIVDHDFIMLEFHDSRNPDISNSDSSGLFATCPYCLDDSDLIEKSQIAIPICKSFFPLENSMLQTPTRPDLLPRVLPRSTV